MKVIIVYREESDYAREVIDYLRDFKHQTGKEVTVLDPDTKEGIDFCRAYDILEYPTIIALSDDSVMQNEWRGRPLPTINELSYYVQ